MTYFPTPPQMKATHALRRLSNTTYRMFGRKKSPGVNAHGYRRNKQKFHRDLSGMARIVQRRQCDHHLLEGFLKLEWRLNDRIATEKVYRSEIIHKDFHYEYNECHYRTPRPYIRRVPHRSLKYSAH